MAESVAQAYNNATHKLSDVVKMLESSPEYRIRGLSLTIDNVDRDVQTGFAIGANMQATIVLP